MGITPQQFIEKYRGKFIFIPGYRTAECVALFWAYNREVNKGEQYSASGAFNLWTQGGQPYLWETYDRSAKLVPGSFAVWSGVRGAYPNGGNGHVAMALKNNGNGTGTFFTQNPGAANQQVLSLDGIVGYLVPKGIRFNAAPQQLVFSRKVTQNVAFVRRAPNSNSALSARYPSGIARGATLAVKGYVAGNDPYGTGDNAWYVTVGNEYVWANAAENNLEGLPKL